MLDSDNIDFSKTMNHIVKSLRFIPDDSTFYLTPIIIGVANGRCMNKWVEKHITDNGKSHSELIFIPANRIVEVFREE